MFFLLLKREVFSAFWRQAERHSYQTGFLLLITFNSKILFQITSHTGKASCLLPSSWLLCCLYIYYVYVSQIVKHLAHLQHHFRNTKAASWPTSLLPSFVLLSTGETLVLFLHSPFSALLEGTQYSLFSTWVQGASA